MTLDRRQRLAAGGALLSSCGAARTSAAGSERLDRLLDAHAGCLPERAGAGANHYPMAAEALEALGYPATIADEWIAGAALYGGELGRAGELDDWPSALGAYDRFGDWLDHFRAQLARRPWRTVVAQWVPQLAPGLSGAAFHGVIRTGHAVRALRLCETAAREHELAVALAYWNAPMIRYSARSPNSGSSGSSRPRTC